MSTKATELGLIVGNEYTVEGDSGHVSKFPVGAKVRFVRDDGSSCPLFRNLATSYEGYAYAQVMVAPAKGVTFEAATRTVETTVIKVDRKLTPAEQAQIAAIIVKGNK
jgi:hypothetical protein